MNIFRGLALKAAQTVLRNLTVRDPDGWYPSGLASDAGEHITCASALSLSAVWACVNLVAGTGGSLPLMVYRTSRNGTRTVAADHPLYRTLHDSPNYDQTAVDFWEFVFASLELWGNAYARIERSTGQVRALHPINPECVSVRRLKNGDLEYRWSEEGQSFIETDRTVPRMQMQNVPITEAGKQNLLPAPAQE